MTLIRFLERQFFLALPKLSDVQDCCGFCCSVSLHSSLHMSRTRPRPQVTHTHTHMHFACICVNVCNNTDHNLLTMYIRQNLSDQIL